MCVVGGSDLGRRICPTGKSRANQSRKNQIPSVEAGARQEQQSHRGSQVSAYLSCNFTSGNTRAVGDLVNSAVTRAQLATSTFVATQLSARKEQCGRNSKVVDVRDHNDDDLSNGNSAPSRSRSPVHSCCARQFLASNAWGCQRIYDSAGRPASRTVAILCDRQHTGISVRSLSGFIVLPGWEHFIDASREQSLINPIRSYIVLDACHCHWPRFFHCHFQPRAFVIVAGCNLAIASSHWCGRSA